MGNFIGHLAPGLFFIIMSIRYALNLLKYHFEHLKRKNDYSIKHDIDYRNAWTNPFETMIIGFILFVSGIIEYSTGFENGPIICADNFQHMTIYVAVVTVFVVYLLEVFSILPIHVPFDALFGMFFGMQAIIIYFHHQGQFELHLHKLLLISILGCCVFSFVSSFNPSNIVVHLAKFVFFFLQGTWLVHVAFIMYPILGDKRFLHEQVINPKNNLHRSTMIITAFFNLQVCFSILVFVFVTIFSYKKYYNSDEKISQKYQGLLEESAIN